MDVGGETREGVHAAGGDPAAGEAPDRGVANDDETTALLRKLLEQINQMINPKPIKPRCQVIGNAFMMAYDLGSVKGMTVYRNGSRSQEVLSPKKINKDMACPECGGTLVKEGGCTHCDKCEYSFCEVG